MVVFFGIDLYLCFETTSKCLCFRIASKCLCFRITSTFPYVDLFLFIYFYIVFLSFVPSPGPWSPQVLL